MLNLLPLRLLLTAIAGSVGIAVLAAVYAGVVGTGNAFADVRVVVRAASMVAFALMTVPYAIWRWIPPLQLVTFPYLGGMWAGHLEFSGSNGSGSRDVTLVVDHSLAKIVLVLDSDESTSRTLAVQAERDSGIKRDRLYYVYLNERKEGVAGAGARYRGLAIMRAEKVNGRSALYGDYFTELGSEGKLHLERQWAHPWWAIWK